MDTQELMAKAEEIAKAKWNQEADFMNQWRELGSDEKDPLIQIEYEALLKENNN